MANSVGNAPIYRQALIDKYIERHAEGNMTARVRITRGVYPNNVLLYEGRARVHLQAAAVQMGFGDEPQYMVSGTISIPQYTEDASAAVLPQVNDLVRVMAHHDNRTVNRTMRIVHIDAGGQFNNIISMSVMGSEESPTAVRPL